jgi:bifunctional oligoribonuclease and PAP phosphatase NrnA
VTALDPSARAGIVPAPAPAPDAAPPAGPVAEADWARAVGALRQASEICLACHVRPDGDALGSMLAVTQALRICRPGASIVASCGDQPFHVPGMLRFLPGLDLVSPPGSVPAAPELMITFDVSSVDRLGVLAGQAERAAELIVLDHHPSNPGFGTINLIDPGAAATAVLAARLIDLLGVPVSAAIATGLYTGLVTDTGSFRFATTPEVHRLAAGLLETGIDPGAIADALWDELPFGYLGMLSAALGRAVLEPAGAGGHGLVWTTVTRADRAPAGLPYEVSEPVVTAVRSTADADVAIVFKESDDGEWHVSARSKGRSDVGRACQAMGGGGHSRAAGFSTRQPVPEVMARLRELLTPGGGTG